MSDHSSSDLVPVSEPDFTVAPIKHKPRMADIDPKAAKRAERQVATMFGLAALLMILSLVSYFAFTAQDRLRIPFFGEFSATNVTVGTTFGVGLLLIGLGAIHWAKKLMPDVEVVAQRHSLSSTEEQRAGAIEAFERGAEESGFGNRPIIRRTLLGAMALVPLPIIVMLKDMYRPAPGTPSPEEILSHTIWGEKPNTRIVSDIANRPIKPEDVPVGGLVAAIPETLPEHQEEVGNLNERGKAAIILVRMAPEEIRSQQGEGWDYQGILAFSKICTHVGCPIALYEQRTHHLLCPCHQSTFDLADSGNVVFGPAARKMPQLPITVDAEGYLVAKSDFQEPVGPSFWERG